MLDLDAMAIPLISPLKLAGVHGDGSAVGLSIKQAQVFRLATGLVRGDLPLPPQRAGRILSCLWRCWRLVEHLLILQT